MNDLLHGPTLWYLNRSTGVVLLALLTVTTLLGVLATGRRGRVLPLFVSHTLHRNLALWSVLLLGLHVGTAVVDTYVDIRWWQAFVPWVGSTYLPLWLGLGTLALDLLVLVTLTSLARARLRHRTWHRIHLLAYAAWALSVGHGLGIGTDLRVPGWQREATWASLGLVTAVVLVRTTLTRFRPATRDVA